MKRALLFAAIALAAVAAVVPAIPVGAQPTVVEDAKSPPVPANCADLAPQDAKSPSRSCRDYLFQIHCQFDDDAWEWESWCLDRERDGLPSIPHCDVDLAAESTDVGMRCRDYLAATRCTGTSSSEAVMEEFCENVAPSAGADPRPRPCDTTLARERTPAGNACWDQLLEEHCKGWQTGDNSGTEDVNRFCDEAVAGTEPPAVNPKCDLLLADKPTNPGRACREQLYASECGGTGDNPQKIERFCAEVAAERSPPSSSPPAPGDEEGASAPDDEEGASAPDVDEGASAPGDATEGSADQSNPGPPMTLLQLGREPACGHSEQLNDEIKRACALTGSVMHEYPFDHYGIDNHVSVDILEGDFWTGETPIMSLFQWLMVGGWQVLIWLLKLSLLIVQWAFAVDPLARSIETLREAVLDFFNLLGPEWRLAAMTIIGAGALWNGVVRMRFVQTFGGAMASVLLMFGAMWIVYDPRGTIGEVSHLANEGALAMMSATSSGKLQDPEEGLAVGQKGIFDRLAVGAWCGMQFGGQGACDAETSDKDVTRKDLWLSVRANSMARGLLYKGTKEGREGIKYDTDDDAMGDIWDALGDGLCQFTAGLSSTCTGSEDVSKSQTEENRENDPEAAQQFDDTKAVAMKLIEKEPEAVKLQAHDGVFPRAGLFIIIAIGMIGAIVFLLSLGVRLTIAGVLLLFLILLAPVMMIVAAFGEEGRKRFFAWLRMLLGTAVAKLVYAILLGLALLVAQILHDINFAPVFGLLLPEPAFAQAEGAAAGADDWLGGWVLEACWWPVATIYTNKFLGLYSPDPAGENTSGVRGAAALWGLQRTMSQAARGAWGGAAMIPKKVAPRVGGMIRREHTARKKGTEAAIRGQAKDEFRDHGLEAHRQAFDDDGLRAQTVLADRFSDRTRNRMADIDEQLAEDPNPDLRDELTARRAAALRSLNFHQAQESWARSEMQRQSLGYQQPGGNEQRGLQFERKRDVEQWMADGKTWDSVSNLRWARISRQEWRKAKADERAGDSTAMNRLRSRSEAALRRDRTLIDRIGGDDPLSRGTRRGALEEWGHGPMYDGRGHFKGRGGGDPKFVARRREEQAKQRKRLRKGLWRPRG